MLFALTIYMYGIVITIGIESIAHIAFLIWLWWKIEYPPSASAMMIEPDPTAPYSHKTVMPDESHEHSF